MTETTSSSWWSQSRFRDQVHHISERPELTADDLEYEKDPEAYERRELRKLWREERPQFIGLSV